MKEPRNLDRSKRFWRGTRRSDIARLPDPMSVSSPEGPGFDLCPKRYEFGVRRTRGVGEKANLCRRSADRDGSMGASIVSSAMTAAQAQACQARRVGYTTAADFTPRDA